jgi:CHAT domain-containing protein
MKVALIEFYIKEDQTFIFVINPHNPESGQKPHVITIDIGEQEIKALKTMIWSFGRASVIVERNLNLFQEIGTTIFKPVLNYLTNCDILYIVPHKNLHYLPFHALEIDDKALCDHFAIVYLPNASLLKYCQENNVLRRRKKYEYKQILSLGVGAREDTASVRNKFITEANQVAETLNPALSSCLTGIHATKAAFLENAPQSELIHIASHGFFDRNTPLGSGPLLAYGRRFPSLGELEDRDKFVLKAEEFYKLKLQANLVTMSGCFTGLSEVRGGDELLGLARGVFAAGVPSMIVSLWEAHHSATMRFMQIFYGELIKGTPKALALQTAQLELRKTPEYRHIKFWAPFILIGDWL